MSDSKTWTPEQRDAIVRALLADDDRPRGLFALGTMLLDDPEMIRPFLQQPELAEQLQREIAAAVWELQHAKNVTVH